MRSVSWTAVGSDLVVKVSLIGWPLVYALVAHETGYLVPADVMAGPAGRLGQLRRPVTR